VTLVACLTWQVPDPVGLSTDLERRLGAGAAAHRSPAGGLVLRLGTTDVHLVAWRAEAADDAPHAGGRLVYEPLFEELSPDAAVAGDGPLASPAFGLAGVAWATVELDRAESELGPWLESPVGEAPDDEEAAEPHLGARTRVRRASGLPGGLIVIAEPAREGRLAASLARDGEGPCALYLVPAVGLDAWRRAAAGRGDAVSAVRPGPLGPSVLVAGPPAGPHLVMVERRARERPTSPDRPGGTIAP